MKVKFYGTCLLMCISFKSMDGAEFRKSKIFPVDTACSIIDSSKSRVFFWGESHPFYENFETYNFLLLKREESKLLFEIPEYFNIYLKLLGEGKIDSKKAYHRFYNERHLAPPMLFFVNKWFTESNFQSDTIQERVWFIDNNHLESRKHIKNIEALLNYYLQEQDLKISRFASLREKAQHLLTSMQPEHQAYKEEVLWLNHLIYEINALTKFRSQYRNISKNTLLSLTRETCIKSNVLSYLESQPNTEIHVLIGSNHAKRVTDLLIDGIADHTLSNLENKLIDCVYINIYYQYENSGRNYVPDTFIDCLGWNENSTLVASEILNVSYCDSSLVDYILIFTDVN